MCGCGFWRILLGGLQVQICTIDQWLHFCEGHIKRKHTEGNKDMRRVEGGLRDDDVSVDVTAEIRRQYIRIKSRNLPVVPYSPVLVEIGVLLEAEAREIAKFGECASDSVKNLCYLAAFLGCDYSLPRD